MSSRNKKVFKISIFIVRTKLDGVGAREIREDRGGVATRYGNFKQPIDKIMDVMISF